MSTSFATAYKELVLEGRVPDDVAHARLTVCAECPAYQGEDNGPGTGHCGACICPRWPVSQMHVDGPLNRIGIPGKAWFPMGCPLGKFPEHPGRRAVQSDAAGRRMESPAHGE